MGHKTTIDIRCNFCSAIISTPGLCSSCELDEEAEREYPDVSIDPCTGPFEQEKLNSIQKKLREAYIKGALRMKQKEKDEEIQAYREALEKIMQQKLEPGEADYKYAFNRCWHIANDQLNQFKQ